MVRHRVYPLVERRVELGDNVLFPLLADESKERLGLVDRVLPSPTNVSAPHAIRRARGTHNRAHRERKDLMQPHETVEERDLRRLPWRLFERSFRVGCSPVLVVTLRRQVNVEAKRTRSALLLPQPWTALIRIRTLRPESHMVARARSSSTCPWPRGPWHNGIRSVTRMLLSA